MENKIHIEPSWGLFIGSFDNNQIHKHYAIQWSIALSAPISISNEKGTNTFQESVLIKSNIIHRFSCSGPHLLLLFSPISEIGHFFRQQESLDIAEYNHSTKKILQSLGKKYLSEQLSFLNFIALTKKSLRELRPSHSVAYHTGDKRIMKGIKYLEQHTDRVVPAKEIAKHCYLSESRFLHLFKKETKITYRQAQLWIKLSLSIPKLFKQNITTTALEYGFSDSAHYSKVFKQNFGFSPKLFSQL